MEKTIIVTQMSAMGKEAEVHASPRQGSNDSLHQETLFSEQSPIPRLS